MTKPKRWRHESKRFWRNRKLNRILYILVFCLSPRKGIVGILRRPNRPQEPLRCKSRKFCNSGTSLGFYGISVLQKSDAKPWVVPNERARGCRESLGIDAACLDFCRETSPLILRYVFYTYEGGRGGPRLSTGRTAAASLFLPDRRGRGHSPTRLGRPDGGREPVLSSAVNEPKSRADRGQGVSISAINVPLSIGGLFSYLSRSRKPCTGHAWTSASTLEARSPERNCSRQYRVEGGTDLFGAAIAALTSGLHAFLTWRLDARKDVSEQFGANDSACLLGPHACFRSRSFGKVVGIEPRKDQRVAWILRKSDLCR